METFTKNIIRPIYMDRITPYINKGLIKVLTGQRRVGKSYILRAVEDRLRQENPHANFIKINLEDFTFNSIRDAETLNNEILSRLMESNRNYIFIDEVQEVEGFDHVLRSLLLDTRNDIYVTGSNSSMLSSEMASRLAGRSIDISVHPLSYQEFLLFHQKEDSEETLLQFLQYGGLPYLINLPEISTWPEYLEALSNTIVYRDIVSRHSVRNTDFLGRLLLFMADNIGQLFTAKRISDYIKSQRISATVTSVQAYVEYITQAYLTNRCRRWDIEGKKYFEIGEKFYYEDLGIRNSIVGYRPQDIGGLLENAVYNQLRIAGYKVMTGTLPKGREIDFIAEKGGEKLYVQVAVNVDDPQTAKREFGNLLDISDNYRKLLVTLRDSSPNTQNGVEMLSLRQFFALPL